MPGMTDPFPKPSVTVPSKVLGDLDASSFCVPTWTTSLPFLTVYLSPSKVTVTSFIASAGIFLPPDSMVSIVQVPWNFLSSFSRSALSSARMLDPPDTARQHAQNSTARQILNRRILHLTRLALSSPL